MWKSDYASEKLSDVDLLVGVVLMARSHMRIARVLGTWKRGLECFFEADSLTKDGNDTNGIKQGLFGNKRILCLNFDLMSEAYSGKLLMVEGILMGIED